MGVTQLDVDPMTQTAGTLEDRTSRSATAPRPGAIQAHLFDVVRSVTGVDLDRFDPSFVAQTLDARSKHVGCSSSNDYVERLCTGDSTETAALTRSLFNHHSEFFRGALTFAMLEERVLPLLVDRQRTTGDREIRIWSAACAAGQEAYSVAILLLELRARHGCPIHFRVLATDSNADALDRGRAGAFEAVDLNNVRLGHLTRWFHRTQRGYAVAPEVRERVEFAPYDLLDTRTVGPPSGLFGTFDLVVCSNVLSYYREEARRSILTKVRRCLVPGGFLVLGDAERSFVDQDRDSFHALASSGSAFHYRGYR